jgi:hypothetical protein
MTSFSANDRRTRIMDACSGIRPTVLFFPASPFPDLSL